MPRAAGSARGEAGDSRRQARDTPSSKLDKQAASGGACRVVTIAVYPQLPPRRTAGLPPCPRPRAAAPRTGPPPGADQRLKRRTAPAAFAAAAGVPKVGWALCDSREHWAVQLPGPSLRAGLVHSPRRVGGLLVGSLACRPDIHARTCRPMLLLACKAAGRSLQPPSARRQPCLPPRGLLTSSTRACFSRSSSACIRLHGEHETERLRMGAANGQSIQATMHHAAGQAEPLRGTALEPWPACCLLPARTLACQAAVHARHDACMSQ